ncbi:MAG: hypothetical protein II153_03160 [Erysipelotrichaceae bacterium]|nr:hypothetical protein [Erysipelotrichaceae bacterium]MBQ5444084.1 hypothetical protein [Erysipelotrichaceae bacterium]MBQ6217912.1 hypothetical protein [Erysipelotrichaceae bacterium]
METDRSRGHPAADLKNSALKHPKEKGHDPFRIKRLPSLTEKDIKDISP